MNPDPNPGPRGLEGAPPTAPSTMYAAPPTYAQPERTQPAHAPSPFVQPAGAPLAYSQPAGAPPAYSQPAGGVPDHAQSAYAQPGDVPSAYAPPPHAQPAYAPPAYAQPPYEPPAYAQPAYAAPAGQPAYAPPPYVQPPYAPPAYAQPAYAAPAGQPAAAPPPQVAPGPVGREAPSRLVVFGQLYWRTVVLSVGGGAVIAFGIGVWAALSSVSNSSGPALVFIPVAVLVGAVLGAFLGFGAGFVTGGIGAGVLVPYRGVKQTRRIMVGTALAIMVPCAIWFVADGVHDATTLLLDAAIVLASLLGAGFGALWLVNWYVKRMAALGFDGDQRVVPPGAPA